MPYASMNFRATQQPALGPPKRTILDISDQSATTHQQDMPNAQFCFPVLLENIDADLTVGTHIGVEDFGQEVAFWRAGREVFAKDQFHTEEASSIWGALYSKDRKGGCSVHTQNGKCHSFPATQRTQMLEPQVKIPNMQLDSRLRTI